MKEANFTIETLTPLWTGGADQTCDRLHETGLIGSLRWWFEALLRGLGGEACDPMEHSCSFDEDKYRKSKAGNGRQRLLDAGVCDACQLFGCTGWARRFRLLISGGQKFFNVQKVLVPSGRKHQTKKGLRAGGWFVFGESRIGEICITPILLRGGDLSPIRTIMALISHYGSFGAKCSNGHGVVEAENFIPDLRWLDDIPDQAPGRDNSLPDFRDFFFARFRFEEPANAFWWQSIDGIRQAFIGELDDGSSPRPLRCFKRELEKMREHGIIPLAPAIRNWLRYKWDHGLSSAEAHFIFGEARSVCPNCYQPGFREDNRNSSKNFCPECKRIFPKEREIPTTASKILVSYAYSPEPRQWEFRIWGWLPCTGVLADRDKFLDSLKTKLQNRATWENVLGPANPIPKMDEWHALDCGQTDGRAYFKELLGGVL
jgi:CRISPR-associated protein Cmr1